MPFKKWNSSYLQLSPMHQFPMFRGSYLNLWVWLDDSWKTSKKRWWPTSHPLRTQGWGCWLLSVSSKFSGGHGESEWDDGKWMCRRKDENVKASCKHDHVVVLLQPRSLECSITDPRWLSFPHWKTMVLHLKPHSLQSAIPGKAIYSMADMSLTNPGIIISTLHQGLYTYCR